MKTLLGVLIIFLLISNISNAQSWKLTGNAGTNPAINFIGTTDAASLVFKVNNKQAGLLEYKSSRANTAFGFQTLSSNSAGTDNAAFGYKALYTSLSGNMNTAVGAWSLYNNFSDWNTGVGSYSLNHNTTGASNTAIGSTALYENTTGYDNTATGSGALITNNTGNLNTATGSHALYYNEKGNYNTANGSWSLFNNTTGHSNTAIGANALYSNKTGHHLVAVGDSALYKYAGSSGYNTAVGSKTLYNNTGTNNTAIGYQALYNNTSGYYNTASGYYALRSNTIGFFNTAVGTTALYGNTGSYNTAVGSSSDVNPGLTNATALGFGAVATASNQVWLGNTSVTSVKAGNNIVIVSDGRFKKNLKENVPGLAFINELRPVTYNYDIHKLNDHIQPSKNKLQDGILEPTINGLQEEAIVKKEKIVYSGFVAQDVEKTAAKLQYDFSGVYKPQNDNDPYGLSYSDFVVPLVKAVQELSTLNNEKDKVINDLQIRLEKIESLLDQPTSSVNSKIQKANIYSASLQQNIPNPFTGSTTVNYTLPYNYSSAKIIIYDKAGKALKQINISGSGKGSVKVDASLLSNGAYTYSLYVDGKLVDSKQMERLR